LLLLLLLLSPAPHLKRTPADAAATVLVDQSFRKTLPNLRPASAADAAASGSSRMTSAATTAKTSLKEKKKCYLFKYSLEKNRRIGAVKHISQNLIIYLYPSVLDFARSRSLSVQTKVQRFYHPL
jgi:hypothetical protein